MPMPFLNHDAPADLIAISGAPAYPPSGSCPLNPAPSPATFRPVSTKQIVADLLQRLPDDATLHDVAREIEFVAGVRQGLAELDRGERIPLEQVERELPSWVVR